MQNGLGQGLVIHAILRMVKFGRSPESVLLYSIAALGLNHEKYVIIPSRFFLSQKNPHLETCFTNPLSSHVCPEVR